MLRKLTLIFFLLMSLKAGAQDPVFSQFYASPLHLNPAFAGITLSPRITLNYRNQWPSWPRAYQTYAATYEQSVDAFNSGLGVILMADQAGDGVYNTNYVGGVYGYKLAFENEWFVKLGMEAGILQTRIDWDRLIFGDQLDPLTGIENPGGIPLTEETRPENLTRAALDVAVGILVYRRNFYGGFSVKHLNRPDESFLQVNENLNVGVPMRISAQAGAEFTVNGGNNLQGPAFISPNILYISQGGFQQINAGAYAGYGKAFGGLWYRVAGGEPDAAIFLVGFRQGIFRFGYSYDTTLSLLSVGRTGGSHEISVSFNFDDSRSLQEKRFRSRYNNCFKMFN